MIRIEISNDRNTVDTAAVAEAFGITPAELEQRMRLGSISSWFERGEGGFHEKKRLIFFSADRGTRVAVDADGTILASADAGSRGSPRHTPSTGGAPAEIGGDENVGALA